MAKLPSRDDLKGLPLEGTNRQVAQAYVPQDRGIGAGLEKLGGAIAGIGDKVQSVQDEREADEVRNAHADLQRHLIELDRKYLEDQDYATREKRFSSEVDDFVKQQAGQFSNDRSRNRYLSAAGPTVSRQVLQQAEHALKQDHEDVKASVLANRDRYMAEAMNPNDDLRNGAKESFYTDLYNARKRGVITAVQERAFKNSFNNEFEKTRLNGAINNARIEGDFDALEKYIDEADRFHRYNSEQVPANVPDNLKEKLARTAREVGVAPRVLAQLIGVEFNFNPRARTGSYNGLTQIGRATFNEAGGRLGGVTWEEFKNDPTGEKQLDAYKDYLLHYGVKDKLQKYNINLQEQPPEKQFAILQAAQFSPNGERWMKAYALGNHDVPVTETKQAGALGSTSINDMAGSRFGRAARGLPGDQVAGAKPVNDAGEEPPQNPAVTLTPKQLEEARTRLLATRKTVLADADREDARAKKQESIDASNEYMKIRQALDDPEKAGDVTYKSISNNEVFMRTNEAGAQYGDKARALLDLHKRTELDKEDRNLGPAFTSILAKTRDNDFPVTDKMLMEAIKNKDITYRGMQALEKEIERQRKDPNLAKSISSLEGEAKKKLIKAGDDIGEPDPDGHHVFGQWQQQMIEDLEKGQRAGHSRQELFNEKSPHYIGGSIQQFANARSVERAAAKDVVSTDPAKYKKEDRDKVISLMQNGKLTPDQGRAIGATFGWWGASAPAAMVPRSGPQISPYTGDEAAVP